MKQNQDTSMRYTVLIKPAFSAALLLTCGDGALATSGIRLAQVERTEAHPVLGPQAPAKAEPVQIQPGIVRPPGALAGPVPLPNMSPCDTSIPHNKC